MDKTLTERLDQFCSDYGQPTIPTRIDDLKLYHRDKVSKEYGRFINQFNVFFDLINDIMLGVNYIPKDAWPKWRGLQYVLITHNLKFIYSAFERLLDGFWEDSLVLGRPAYEALFRTLYISHHPENAEAVIVKQKNGKEFNLTHFMEHELKLEWYDYKFYSVFSHSNKYKVLQEWIRISTEGQKEPLMIKLKFEKDEFEIGVNYLLFLGTAYLKVATELFATSYNESLTEVTVKRAKVFTDLWHENMKTHKKDYWPKVANDLDRIFDDLTKLKNEKSLAGEKNPREK